MNRPLRYCRAAGVLCATALSFTPAWSQPQSFSESDHTLLRQTIATGGVVFTGPINFSAFSTNADSMHATAGTTVERCCEYSGSATVIGEVTFTLFAHPSLGTPLPAASGGVPVRRVPAGSVLRGLVLGVHVDQGLFPQDGLFADARLGPVQIGVGGQLFDETVAVRAFPLEAGSVADLPIDLLAQAVFPSDSGSAYATLALDPLEPLGVHIRTPDPLRMCIADVDDGSGTGEPDGGVTIEDLLYYLVIFADGGIASDVDDGTFTGTPDGGVTIEDLLYYLFRFERGC